jgi:hypothetical protein
MIIARMRPAGNLSKQMCGIPYLNQLEIFVKRSFNARTKFYDLRGLHMSRNIHELFFMTKLSTRIKYLEIA